MHDSDISPLTRLVSQLAARMDANDSAAPHAGPPLADDMVPSGFQTLDLALGGGFRRGDLVVLGGDHSSGCSALALTMAQRAALGPSRQRGRALLVSTEQLPSRIHERLLAAESRVSLDHLRLGAVSEEEHIRLAAAALALRDRVPVVETLSSGQVADVATALDASPGTALVVVDALGGFVHGSGGLDDALAQAVLEFKRLALKRQVVVLLTTHLAALDRSRRDLRPRLEDFGMRGAVGAHADVVLGLYREELYEADLGVAGAAELAVLKHRDGARGYVDLYFDGRFVRFEDVLDG
jgi:replicative DNA helicase